jgi:hypothetical protein
MAVLCRGLEKNGTIRAWHGHGMVSVNPTRPHCVNQMGKTHSKPLAAGHGRGTAWARHAICESVLTVLRTSRLFIGARVIYLQIPRSHNDKGSSRRLSVNTVLNGFHERRNFLST